MENLDARLDSGIEYRRIDVQALELRAGDQGEDSMVVEGYATTFNQPYELINYGDYIVREQVDPHAFDGCDMHDVIMQYDHAGRVFARTRNHTLSLAVDDHGLKIRADLSGTELGRQLFEEIRGGYTDRMSFGFTVASDDRNIKEHANGATEIMRTITGFKRLFDVSAVSMPANDATEISARSAFDGQVEELRALEQARAEEKARETEARQQTIAEIRRLLGKENT